MRANHMDAAQRRGGTTVVRTKATRDSREHHERQAVLEEPFRTCMVATAKDKARTFCDKCHNYTGVKPYCWDCHVEPSRGPSDDG